MAGKEGFCGTCRMIVDLTYTGKLINHGSRKQPHGGYTEACAGTGELPSPLPDTPEDPQAAFHTTPPIRECSVCGSPDLNDKGSAVINHHRIREAWCEGGGKVGPARPR